MWISGQLFPTLQSPEGVHKQPPDSERDESLKLAIRSTLILPEHEKLRVPLRPHTHGWLTSPHPPPIFPISKLTISSLSLLWESIWAQLLPKLCLPPSLPHSHHSLSPFYISFFLLFICAPVPRSGSHILQAVTETSPSTSHVPVCTSEAGLEKPCVLFTSSSSRLCLDMIRFFDSLLNTRQRKN